MTIATMNGLLWLIPLLIILVCLVALVLVSEGRRRGIFGGAARVALKQAAAREKAALESQNVVVDTLNLAHWLKRQGASKTVGICDILTAIEDTAPVLRRRFPGQIIYVTKFRETRPDKDHAARLRALYQAMARRCRVHVDVVERLPDEDIPMRQKPHASLGRDDFYLIMLAWKLRAPVLSRDRFRDLEDMKRGDLDKFHVYRFSPAKDQPERDFVNPAAAEFARMRAPVTIDYADVLPDL